MLLIQPSRRSSSTFGCNARIQLVATVMSLTRHPRRSAQIGVVLHPGTPVPQPAQNRAPAVSAVPQPAQKRGPAAAAAPAGAPQLPQNFAPAATDAWHLPHCTAATATWFCTSTPRSWSALRACSRACSTAISACARAACSPRSGAQASHRFRYGSSRPRGIPNCRRASTA